MFPTNRLIIRHGLQLIPFILLTKQTWQVSLIAVSDILESLRKHDGDVLDAMSQKMNFYSCYCIGVWLSPRICFIPQNCGAAQNLYGAVTSNFSKANSLSCAVVLNVVVF